ncbi:uncharacterized protein LOC115890929 [Sitophilus oryzae]|uniref:Uncharacterized protein LOC115890929 n=1 Tax=Sitophilus oryzae TaxID=7048 RepID=A0A6J2YSS1_SITOR|nr:uncharacterized protein LOC115890929 [Sitophilus oryzae]
MSDKLNIFQKAVFDEVVVKEQEHTYYPQTNSFGNNDEIEIIINQQDILVDFSSGYLYLECVFKPINEGEAPRGKCKLTNNVGAYLFESISYELNGKEIDKVRDPGLVTAMRGYLCYTSNEVTALEGAGWCNLEKKNSAIATYHTDNSFTLRIPLSHLFSVFHDYRRVLTGKHKFRLIRARTDDNCYESSGTSTATIEVQKIELKVKHVHPNDKYKLHLLEQMNTDKVIQIPFRQWEFHELPALRSTHKDVWSVKTASNLMRPRYVCIAFQTDRKDNSKASVSEFDHLNLRNIRLWLNSEIYPFENQNFDFKKKRYTEAFQIYCDFQKIFYGRNTSFPLFNYDSFEKFPIFVIDSSKQEDIKSSTVDVKLEFEASENFPLNTRCYCIIVHDKIFEYSALTTAVKELL